MTQDEPVIKQELQDEPVIKQESESNTNMPDNPTHTNIPHFIHLDFVLFANQQIMLDCPSNLEYGEIAFDKLTPKEHIPPMEKVQLLTISRQWSATTSTYTAATFRCGSSFTEEKSFSGYGHKGFSEFLAAAQASSRMARLHVDLRMARPLPKPEPMVNTLDMEHDQLATSPPLASSNRAQNRLPPPDENNLLMAEFLSFCKIPRHERKIWKLLERHKFYHWSAFQGVTKLELRRLRFAFGAVQLLHAGVICYEAFLAASSD
ncbi:hypothetical protein PCASD_08254 [Puccinia coronata f. sp. avenae]|uniref:Uncharacterized protein n=1 Tax=Puccinia coronata f. sp. avenae TaxID=200324 RepID=A0A2N5ULM4_9BASI|nr:hypothetical protein PCASD_08254 [Puccinia coronata f. sp. avenae]